MRKTQFQDGPVTEPVMEVVRFRLTDGSDEAAFVITAQDHRARHRAPRCAPSAALCAGP